MTMAYAKVLEIKMAKKKRNLITTNCQQTLKCKPENEFMRAFFYEVMHD